MEISGWITMILSISFVSVFFGYTLFLVLTHKEDEEK